MNLPVVFSLISFAMVIVLSVGVFLHLNTRSTLKTWRRRVEVTGVATESVQSNSELSREAMFFLLPVLEWFSKLNQPSNDSELNATRKKLIHGGYRSLGAPIFFRGARLFLAVVTTVLIALIPTKVLGFPTITTIIFYYVLAAASGYYAPVLWLNRAIAVRKDALQRAIPDALDLMVVCVEAGLGLDQAIGRVGKEMLRTHPTLSDELNVLGLELRTGLSRQQALKNFASRTDLEEVQNLVALLVQTDRFGTSVGQALRVHSDAMRTTRRLRAEEIAAKLPVKLLFPLIFFIFPSMFIVLLGPAAIQMIRVLFPTLSGR